MMKYFDFRIRIGSKLGEGEYGVTVTTSPRGEARGTFKAPESLQEIRAELPGLWRHTPPTNLIPEPSLLKQLGKELYDALFAGDVRRVFISSLTLTGAADETGLRIRIERDPDDNYLNSLPWEFLYSAEDATFLALSRFTPVVRYWPSQNVRAESYVFKIARVLLVLSGPRDLPALDLRQERSNLEISLGDTSHIEMVILENPTIQNLRAILIEKNINIVHFIGHAIYDEATSEGALLLEDEGGQSTPVASSTLRWIFHDSPSLKLVFLSACDTARVRGRG